MNKYQCLSTAVGWTKKKVRIWDGQVRWLDHNREICLTLKQVTSKNAEFYVNNNTNHTIWYSQLTEVFIQTETLDLCSGEIIKKSGEKLFTLDMGIEAFINFVSGRKFCVAVNPDGEVAKFDGTTLPYGISYPAAQKLVADLVRNNDIEGAAKYLLPATEYTLIEI
ncbi:MAG: hypothetical protein K2K75_13235 [Muribaculaceae bacterium]|nr:hypothetical protein [Muribaculaceae bacterium]